MSHKLDAAAFLEGREAYLAKTPLLQITERTDALATDPERERGAESFMIGFLDGALADLRDCAQRARERN